MNYMLKIFQPAEQIYADIKKNDYVYFTAECLKQNKMVGYCAVQYNGEYLLLSKIYVLKDYRENGIARGFLEETVALRREEYGLDKIRLTVNKYNDGAIAAYQKMGFETFDSVITDIGEGFFMDDFVMELSVKRLNGERE